MANKRNIKKSVLKLSVKKQSGVTEVKGNAKRLAENVKRNVAVNKVNLNQERESDSSSKESYDSDVTSPDISIDEEERDEMIDCRKNENYDTAVKNNSGEKHKVNLDKNMTADEAFIMKEFIRRKNLMNKRCVRVGRMNRKTSTEEILTLVKDYIGFNFPMSAKKNGRYMNRGFGFINFASDEAAKSAVACLNGKLVRDHKLEANLYRCTKRYDSFTRLNLCKLLVTLSSKDDMSSKLTKLIEGANKVSRNYSGSYCVIMKTKEAAMALFKDNSKLQLPDGKKAIVNFYYDSVFQIKQEPNIKQEMTNEKRADNNLIHSDGNAKENKMVKNAKVTNYNKKQAVKSCSNSSDSNSNESAENIFSMEVDSPSNKSTSKPISISSNKSPFKLNTVTKTDSLSAGSRKSISKVSTPSGKIRPRNNSFSDHDCAKKAKLDSSSDITPSIPKTVTKIDSPAGSSMSRKSIGKVDSPSTKDKPDVKLSTPTDKKQAAVKHTTPLSGSDSSKKSIKVATPSPKTVTKINSPAGSNLSRKSIGKVDMQVNSPNNKSASKLATLSSDKKQTVVKTVTPKSSTKPSQPSKTNTPLATKSPKISKKD